MNKKLIGLLLFISYILVIPSSSTITNDKLFSSYLYAETFFGNSNKTINVDWWTSYRHDLFNTGFSTSDAPSSNEILWRDDILRNGLSTTPVIYNNCLYLAPYGSTFYCLDMYSGEEVWKASFGNFHLGFSSPVISEDKVYYGASDGYYCLDSSNGNKIWTFVIDNDFNQFSPSAVYENKLYFGANNNKVYCLDAISGEKIWEFDTAGGVLESCPAIVNNKVLIGSRDHYLYCIDSENGELIWKYEVPHEIRSSPLIALGNVYFGCMNGRFYCLNMSDGEYIWSYTTSGPITSSPAFTNIYNNSIGCVFFGSLNNKMYCLNVYSGDLIWSYETKGDIWSSPSVNFEKIFFGSHDGNVYCLDINSGNKIWNYTFPINEIYCTPAIVDNKLYIGPSGGGGTPSKYGHLYCFIGKNRNPLSPDIKGPTEGYINIEYDFTVNTIDPDRDLVYYKFNWGDGNISDWIGPFESGANYTISHSWSRKNDYILRVKAKDELGAESEWTTLEVSMPISKSQDMSNKIIYVDDDGGADYTKIQDAIDNASNGDTIFVYNGTYNENINISKSVIIVGQNRNNTKINGKENTSIKIVKDNVSIKGFTIENSGDNAFHAGIWINANNTIIYQNIIRNNYNGVVINNYCNNSIINCDINNPESYYFSEYGIKIKGEKAKYNYIKNCNIQDNIRGSGSGIYLDTSLYNTINNCSFENNGRSIYLHDSNNNDVYNCVVNNKIEIKSLSNNNTIKNCMLMSSISLNSCDYNSITDNSFINSALNLHSCKGSNIINNSFTNKGISIDYSSSSIIEENYIQGKPIIYYSQISNTTIDQSAGQIIIHKCQNLTIQDQEISDTKRAIQLINSKNCKIVLNELRNNNVAINIQKNSNNCKISMNYLVDNTEAIKISQGLNSIVENNTIYNSYIAILCSNSNDISLQNNTINIDGNSAGIKLQSSNNCFINKNEINCNNQNDEILNEGVRLQNSDNNIMEKNTISEFDFSIFIYHSENNYVFQNNLYSKILPYFQRAKYDNLDEVFSNDYDSNYYGRLFVTVVPVLGFLLIKESDIPLGWDFGIPFIFSFDVHPVRIPYDI